MSRWKKWAGSGLSGAGYTGGVAAFFTGMSGAEIVMALVAIGGSMVSGIAIIAGGAVVVTSAGFVVGNYFDK
jgi:hypothetical protein